MFGICIFWFTYKWLLANWLMDEWLHRFGLQWMIMRNMSILVYLLQIFIPINLLTSINTYIRFYILSQIKYAYAIDTALLNIAHSHRFTFLKSTLILSVLLRLIYNLFIYWAGLVTDYLYRLEWWLCLHFS